MKIELVKWCLTRLCGELDCGIGFGCIVSCQVVEDRPG